MDMDETDELSTIKEQLKIEQERVLKLKAIVIREKKNGSSLSAEVELLSSQLNELKQENAALRIEVQKHASSSLNDNLSELEEKLNAAERELKARVAQLQQKNLAFNQLSEELNQLMAQLDESNKQQQVYINLNDQLKFQLREQLTLLQEKEKTLHDNRTREEDLQSQLNQLRTEYSSSNEVNLKKIKELEKNEFEAKKRLAEEEIKTKKLRDMLSEARNQATVKDTPLVTVQSELERSNLLVSATEADATLQQHTCVVDELGSSMSVVNAPTIADKCRECLTCLEPLFNSKSLPNSDLDHPEVKRLLDSFAEFLHSHRQVDSSIDRCGKNYFPSTVNDTVSYVLSSKVDAQTQCNLLSNHDHSSLQESLTYYDQKVDPSDQPHSSIVLSSEDLQQTSDRSDHTGDVARLQMLEVKVNDLEKYAAEQMDRAKSQLIDWSQKLEVQAADYDHLLRDKETEISELRETCDRFSEEVSIYANFCSSVMVLVGESDTSLDEKTIDWLGAADALNSSENQVSGYELGGLLETLYRELNTRIESNPVRNQTAENEPTDSAYELDEMKEQLNFTKNALEEANKRASDAESSLTELQDEVQKRDEKIQRMKQLLIRLKLDASGQQKAAANLEEMEKAKQDLVNELEDRTRELEEMSSAKEQAESALLLAREETCQLRIAVDSLKEEHVSALRRLNQLQAEYSAYKVKALHTLRSSHSTEPATKAIDSGNIKASHLEDSTAQVDPDAQTADLERLNHLLLTAQQAAEEASLRASLARTECDMAKEDLSEVRQKYSDLLKEFRDQREIWETKLGTLTRERQHEATDRIKELEEKLTVSQAQFDDQLQKEQARQQRLVCDERAIWTVKLDKAMEENKLLQEELETLRRSLKSSVPTPKGTSPTQAQPVDLSSFSPRQLLNRVQGDGADYVADDFDTPPGSHRSSGHSSLLDERRKPLMLPLEQLLNSPNVPLPITSNFSSLGSPHPSRHQSGDLVQNDSFGSTSAASQITGLRVALNNQQRRVEHLSELLNESEVNVARLEEQAKVLKEEIRRLERIALRESQFSLPNPSGSSESDQTNQISEPNSLDTQLRTEYLKNVVLKLVCSPSDSVERPQLVSVLSSLLILSPTEQKALQDGVLVSKSNAQSNTSSSSWTSYLAAWTSSKG